MAEHDVGAERWDEVYDREEDVYYVSFGTGEPSYCLEVDDMLVLEIGMFSNLPTGYRILNMSAHETRQVPMEEAKKHLEDVLRTLPTGSMQERSVTLRKSLDKVFA